MVPLGGRGRPLKVEAGKRTGKFSVRLVVVENRISQPKALDSVILEGLGRVSKTLIFSRLERGSPSLVS